MIIKLSIEADHGKGEATFVVEGDDVTLSATNPALVAEAMDQLELIMAGDVLSVEPIS